MSRITLALLLLVPLVVPGSVLGQEPPPVPELTLMPGDVLRLTVWREKDLTGDFQIDQEGRVVLPMVGEWSVTGQPWRELKEEILQAFRRELRNPSIEIKPLRRIYVMGEVTVPGLYPVDPTISLAGAVATAGGPNPQGDLRRIRVVRGGEVILDGIEGEGDLSAMGIRSGDEIYVQRRSWFERNGNFLITAAVSLTTIIVTIVAR